MAAITTAQYAHPHVIESLKNTYFRSGPRTHLHVSLLTCDDTVTLTWTFMFQDMGSFHRISGASNLSLLEPNGDIFVDGVPCSTAQQVERLIFDRHYEDYVREFYAEEGVTTGETV